MNDKQIFIVEDNEAEAMLMEKFLSKLGHDCDVFYNAESAMNAFTEHKYVIGFIDIRLPKMNGICLVGELIKYQRSLKIVFTCYEPGDLFAIPQSILFSVIKKPITLISVQAALT